MSSQEVRTGTPRVIIRMKIDMNYQGYRGYRKSEYHVSNIHKRCQITRRLVTNEGYQGYHRRVIIGGLSGLSGLCIVMMSHKQITSLRLSQQGTGIDNLNNPVDSNNPKIPDIVSASLS